VSRKRAWLKDELILCLDLYRAEGKKASSKDMAELSGLLRSLPIELELSDDPKFRSERAVSQKLHNFVHIDPDDSTEGFPHGGKMDQVVWDEFWGHPQLLIDTAKLIRANVESIKPQQVDPEPEIEDALEGRLLTRVHRSRERSGKLVKRKKAQAKKTDAMHCEGCGFDFEQAYGKRGDGFIECHHLLPVSQLAPGQPTTLADLALVCSNCHRMIHRNAPWLSMDQLRAIVVAVGHPQ